ncbi:hypothetical protein SDJN02_13421, partial [Cucurbita argyrosperma subsp. argyrosperma]
MSIAHLTTVGIFAVWLHASLVGQQGRNWVAELTAWWIDHLELIISTIFSKLILHDSVADKTQWYEDEQVEINMYLRQKEQSSVLSLKRTNHALPCAANYSHYSTFCSTLMGLISIGGNCSRSLKS